MTTLADKNTIKLTLHQLLFLAGGIIYTLLIALESTRFYFLFFLGGMGGLFILFFKKEWIIPVIFATLFIPISINASGISLRPADFLLGFAFLVFLFDFSLQGGRNFVNLPYYKTLLLFILATFLGLTQSRHFWGSISDIIQIIELYIIGGLVLANYLNERTLKQVVIICVVGTLIQDIFVFPAIIAGERFFGWTHGIFAFVSIFVALVMYHRLIYFPNKHIFGNTIAFAMICIGILASGTRSALLATIIGLLLANFIKSRQLFRKSLFFLVLILVFIIALGPPAISNRIQSIVDFEYFSNVSRFFLIGSAWNAFWQNPLTGVGIKNFHHQLPDFLPEAARYLPVERKQTIIQEFIDGAGAHNMYMEILAELGILGFIAMVLLIFQALKDARQNLKFSASPYQRAQNSCVYSCLAAFFIMALFLPGIHVRIDFTIFLILLLAIIKIEQTNLATSSNQL